MMSFLPGYRKILKPRHSLSPRAAVRLAGLYGALASVLSMAFIALGAWPIAPFFVLEFAVLAGALAMVLRQRRHREIVIVNDRSLKVIRHIGRRRFCTEFQRYWVRIRLERAYALHPLRLLAYHRERSVEIGACLREEDKQIIARELQQVLRR